jgi:hypothetical protein
MFCFILGERDNKKGKHPSEEKGEPCEMDSLADERIRGKLEKKEQK